MSDGTAEDVVLHVVARADWEAGDDPLTPSSLATDGFVHLARPDQLAGVCNRFFAGRDDLLVLVVDPDDLPLPLVWEDIYGHGTFPHLYGPLPRGAVSGVVPHRPGPDGTFGPLHLP